MPELSEEEFLRRVKDPDLIEARAQRSALRRAQRAGLTDEQRRLDEDLKFADTTSKLRQAEWSLKKIEELAAAKSKIPTFDKANEVRLKGLNVDQKAAWAREALAKGVSKREIAERARPPVTVRTVERWLKR